MSRRSHLYIFEKKEVLLIFVFVVLFSATSFMLGVKLGKSYSLEQEGFQPEDEATVDLLSQDEEEVKAALEERAGEAPSDSGEFLDGVHEKLKEKIAQELNNKIPTEAAKETTPPDGPPSPPLPQSLKDRSGKYTVQLGSYRTRKEAEEFADGFRIKGHEPIVNAVTIEGRGLWFRVSLGEFDDILSAKEYVSKEKELFMGQDYVFGRFE